MIALQSAKQPSSSDQLPVDYGNIDRTMAAASKVFNTNELLDLILQQLDSSDTGVSKRVTLTCKSFKATIDSSPALRQRTNFAFYRTVSQPTFWARESLTDLQKLHEYHNLKTNKRFHDFYLPDTTHAVASDMFFFASYGDDGTFERYRNNMLFRNTRVCDGPLEQVDFWIRTGFKGQVAVAPGQDITFGQLFDEVARIRIDNAEPSRASCSR